jgi:hypothetical protein
MREIVAAERLGLAAEALLRHGRDAVWPALGPKLRALAEVPPPVR